MRWAFPFPKSSCTVNHTLWLDKLRSIFLSTEQIPRSNMFLCLKNFYQFDKRALLSSVNSILTWSEFKTNPRNWHLVRGTKQNLINFVNKFFNKKTHEFSKLTVLSTLVRMLGNFLHTQNIVQIHHWRETLLLNTRMAGYIIFVYTQELVHKSNGKHVNWYKVPKHLNQKLSTMRMYWNYIVSIF